MGGGGSAIVAVSGSGEGGGGRPDLSGGCLPQGLSALCGRSGNAAEVVWSLRLEMRKAAILTLFLDSFGFLISQGEVGIVV